MRSPVSWLPSSLRLSAIKPDVSTMSSPQKSSYSPYVQRFQTRCDTPFPRVEQRCLIVAVLHHVRKCCTVGTRYVVPLQIVGRRLSGINLLSPSENSAKSLRASPAPRKTDKRQETVHRVNPFPQSPNPWLQANFPPSLHLSEI